MSAIIHQTVNILQSTLLVITGLPVVYHLFFAVSGLFYRQKPYRRDGVTRKIAVLIPGYREDAVIVNVAREALCQDYPKDMYEVFVIADSFRPETISALKLLPLTVIEVVFSKSTKVRALRRAMQKLDTSFDIVLVLDADNIMEPGFLSKINAAFNESFPVVQGHRKAANLDNSLAILDAASEEINNHIFRKGHRAVGLSSAIIGSGMAFRSDYFRALIGAATAVGGFDKELELRILKEGNTIGYLDDAVIYDEKVRREETFHNQRRRWLSSQFHYLRQDFLPGLRELFTKRNVDYFDKVIQFMLPPRILLLGGVVIFSAFFIPYNLMLGTTAFVWLWTTLTGMCLLFFFLSLPGYFYNAGTLKAIASLPKGAWLMLGSLLRIRGANKEFIHTVHGTTVKTKS